MVHCFIRKLAKVQVLRNSYLDPHRYRKPARKWFILCILPLVCAVAGLILIVLSAFLHAGHTGAGTPWFAQAVGILATATFVVGIVDLVLVIIWLPLFARELYYDPSSHTRRLDKAVAVIFAVVFGLFAWLYTYDLDKTKFWVNLALSVVTLTLWSTVAWIWAIIDMARRPAAFFEYFPRYGQPTDSTGSAIGQEG